MSSDSPKAILLWDIENMPPPAVISPHDIMKYLRDTFIWQHGLRETKAVCSFNLHFLKKLPTRVEKELVASAVCMLISSCSNCKKRDSDYVLQRELQSFATENIHHATECRIILITSDSDFAMSIETILKLGYDVQLVYQADKCGKHLLSLPYKSKPIQWEHVMTVCNGGILPDMAFHKEKEAQTTYVKKVHVGIQTTEPCDANMFEYKWSGCLSVYNKEAYMPNRIHMAFV